ncbi:MAG: NAD(P)/FAD-dependent oxidoreductase [Clostridia bacterium]|nr:NAD(P)/FAD-dependent oxidoreductase [Clostridia bacterium]
MRKVIVVGAGAAGLLAAATAANGGAEVCLIERNARPARKVMITGKGRCNITNNTSVQEVIANTPTNGRFLYSALSAWTPQDTMALIEQAGVPLKTERGNRVFPVSDQAVDIVDALVGIAQSAGVRFLCGRVTALIIADGVCAGVRLEDGAELPADAVIVCTGGKSYPTTGSTGDGYALAVSAGHTVTPLRPSLVALESDDPLCAAAMGVSLKNCGLVCVDKATGKTIAKDFGEMLFTHFGVSGPMVLSASAHMTAMAKNRYELHIDLKPALTPEQVDARLQRDFKIYANSDLGNAFRHLLPQSLVRPFLRKTGVPSDTKCHTVTQEQRKRLGAALKSLPIKVVGFRPIEEAIVTSGGVDVKEINARTMASKLCEGLYFAGEVLDVDAYTGGFNLQIAFATGAAAGRAVAD